MRYRFHRAQVLRVLSFSLIVLVNTVATQIPDLTGTWNVTVTGVNGTDEYRWEMVKDKSYITVDQDSWVIERTLVKTSNFARQPLIGQSERGGSIVFREGKFSYKQGSGLFVQAATCSLSGEALTCDKGNETIGLANGREFPLTISGTRVGGVVTIPMASPSPPALSASPSPSPPSSLPTPTPKSPEALLGELIGGQNPANPAPTPKPLPDEGLVPSKSSLDNGVVASAEPAAAAVSTATDGTFLSNIPSVGGTVTSFRFFTTNDDIPPPQGRRQYQTRFSKASTGTIYYEFSVKYVTENAANFTMASTWSRGTVPLVRQELPVAKPANWNTSTRSYGFGGKEPGKWETGTYTVIVEVEGRKVAQSSFVVY